MEIVTAHNTSHVYSGRLTASGAPDCVTVVFAPDGSVASVRSNGRPMSPDAPKARKAIEAIRAQPFALGVCRACGGSGTRFVYDDSVPNGLRDGTVEPCPECSKP